MNGPRKGSRWTTAVAAWLNSMGWATTRRANYDPGDDISVNRDGVALSVECKNVKKIDLAGFADQAERQVRAVGSVPLVVIHRRGRSSVDDAYILLSGRSFSALVTALTASQRQHPDTLDAAAPTAALRLAQERAV